MCSRYDLFLEEGKNKWEKKRAYVCGALLVIIVLSDWLVLVYRIVANGRGVHRDGRMRCDKVTVPYPQTDPMSTFVSVGILPLISRSTGRAVVPLARVSPKKVYLWDSSIRLFQWFGQPCRENQSISHEKEFLNFQRLFFHRLLVIRRHIAQNSAENLMEKKDERVVAGHHGVRDES